MEYARWYDEDENLRHIMKALESLDEELQSVIAQDIIQVVMEHTGFCFDECIERLDDSYVAVRRRWYDKDPNMCSAIELIKEIPKEMRVDALHDILSTLYQVLAERGLNE